jgi:uncharacterized LabA/DUF88 family protein
VAVNIERFKLPSIAILIDGMYLQHACDLFGVGHLDYERKLPKMLMREGETHYRTYYFDALPYVPESGATEKQHKDKAGKKAFFDALRYKEGIVVEEGVVRPKRAVCFNCKTEYYVPVQKLVDVKIAVRLTSLAFSKVANKIVLLAGDRDLVPAVEASEPSGTPIRLAYFSEGDVQTSRELIKKCPEKHPLRGADLAVCELDK